LFCWARQRQRQLLQGTGKLKTQTVSVQSGRQPTSASDRDASSLGDCSPPTAGKKGMAGIALASMLQQPATPMLLSCPRAGTVRGVWDGGRFSGPEKHLFDVNAQCKRCGGTSSGACSDRDGSTRRACLLCADEAREASQGALRQGCCFRVPQIRRRFAIFRCAKRLSKTVKGCLPFPSCPNVLKPKLHGLISLAPPDVPSPRFVTSEYHPTLSPRKICLAQALEI
jgi:hypothetical protein